MSKHVPVQVNPIAPTLDVPDKAPPPSFDLTNPDLTFVDLFPENFYSLEGLQAITDEMGGPLVLTVASASIEYIYNPEKGEDSGQWKPVLSFAEATTKLVLNKTRARVVMQLAGSPLIRNWHNIGSIAIKPGIVDGKAQIQILRPPKRTQQPTPRKNGKAVDDKSIDELNQELFG